MTLRDLLAEMGFNGGTNLRYSSSTEMVMFFLNFDRHNPAVTQCGVVVSVGTAPVQVHGKIADTRVRNPLHGRRDFDLNDPDSLVQIEEYLKQMIDKCEPKYWKQNKR